MAGPTSPVYTVSLHHSSGMQTTNDASMCSSVRGLHDEVSTPTSKRQRLSPLEVPDISASDLGSSRPHRLSDNGNMSASYHMQSPHGTPQAQRVTDVLDKPPLSPNDPCLGMDLRKAALLRSLMLATEGSAGTPACEIQHSKPKAAKKGKWKPKQSCNLLPACASGADSMDLDGKSDRSSASPDTASSVILKPN